MRIAAIFAVLLSVSLPANAGEIRQAGGYKFNDCHFHLTDYVQEGLGLDEFLKIMGDDVGRVALFGIPLQQTWSYANSGEFNPTYYLQSDAPLYYYSFTDAYIAALYKSLPEEQRARFDPMITGFNPADMYGVDHIRRVLHTFPGVFSGIGEFSVHKEFVSAKIAGETASLTNPALDRILAFAAESGLLVLIHNDIDMPFAKMGAQPVYLDQMKALLKRHPKVKIIWAHVGLGRVVRPVQALPSDVGSRPDQISLVDDMLRDPALRHLHFDISWEEVAKYILSSPEVTRRTANLLNRYPDRFLFGTDAVAPANRQEYLKIFQLYLPLWELLDEATREKVQKKNYERLFDEARRKVRAWERANVRPAPPKSNAGEIMKDR